MRQACTWVREHGANKFKPLFGPDVPILDQRAAFKEARGREVDEKLEEYQIWEPREQPRVTRFITPAAKKARDEAHAKAIADAKAKEERAKKETARAEAKTQSAKDAEAKANQEAQAKASAEAEAKRKKLEQTENTQTE